VLVAGIAVAIGFGHTTGRSHATRADHGGGPAGAPSAVGKSRIAFATSQALESVGSDGSGLQTIAHCPATKVPLPVCGVFEPAWSPDGRETAYVLGTWSWPGTGGQMRLTLYVRGVTGGSARRLADCVTCGEQHGSRLSWSPDGTRIVYGRRAGNQGQEALWVVDVASGRSQPITGCPHSSCAYFDRAWSPDGRRIAFARLVGWASALYTVRPDGSGLTRITSRGQIGDPQWSPDGHQLAFEDGDDIFVANANGSHERLIVRREPGNGRGQPSWSPDGSKLAYFKTQGGYSAEVWTVHANGSDKHRLYHSGCCIEISAAPIWSPDGTKIAFSANSANGTFVIGANGRDLRRVSPDPAVALSWQPS